tara:strand:+ start:81 stop:959 length:879 start_codon:yes stop_codon:yes gene_type:complete
MSTLEVNKIIPQGSGTNLQLGENGDTVDIPSGATLDATGATVTGVTGDGKILISAQDTTRNYLQSKIVAGTNITITLNNSGGNESITFASSAAEVKPTVTGVNPSTITNAATNVVITGTNFVSIPQVEAIASTGAIIAANTITFTSATSLTANFTLPTDGSYFIRVENNDGNAGRSSSALLTVSDEPAWTTAAGSLGTIAGNFSGTVATVAATGDSTLTFSETTNVLTNAGQANCSLNSSTGVITTSDFGGSSTSATTYNFTLRVTDAEGQTADRAFSLTSSFSLEESGRFD